MGLSIYNFLVNKQPGIKRRYHDFHDNATGCKIIFSWIYLVWLNFAYYVLHLRFLGKEPLKEIYEEKELLTDISESEAAIKQITSSEKLVELLSDYDVISFDIFDTLIFRPFSSPTDLFYFLGEQVDILDFRRIREEQEFLAREDCRKEKGHTEVGLSDIWRRIEREVGISADTGETLEKELELKFCYANPYMKQVFETLKEKGKRIIIISDMYLSAEFEEKLLKNCGYSGFEKLYVSSDYGFSKGDGKLFGQAKADMGKDLKFAHIGDNPYSDVKKAQEAGFAAVHYPNINKSAGQYRSQDMSPMIGGAYRGIVNNRLYSGLKTYTMEYEYGFIYGGLFVLGYCRFIHDYCLTNGVDKLLFLARDGDILKRAYDKLYPDEATEYVFWSRAAATKLMMGHNHYDFIRRYVNFKINQNISLEKIFAAFDGEELLPLLEKESNGEMRREMVLTKGNADSVRNFIQKHFHEIENRYKSSWEAAKKYYSKVLAGCHNAVAIDIGWAGSGAISLSHLLTHEWHIDCRLTGIVAGTNTVNSSEFDASESYLQSGKLVSYLYSLSHNTDIMKKHDPNKDYNIFWELLLSSTNRQFRGFRLKGEEVEFDFGKADANQKGIRDVQEGILDFISDYMEHFGHIPYMTKISGRDAYAPMLVAASSNEKYLKVIEKKFKLVVNVE